MAKALHKEGRLDLAEVWTRLNGPDRAVVVDSPPGAGKSTLGREITRRLVAAGSQVPIVVQTNDQADDLVAALARTDVAVGRLHGGDWTPPSGFPRLRRSPDADMGAN